MLYLLVTVYGQLQLYNIYISMNVMQIFDPTKVLFTNFEFNLIWNVIQIKFWFVNVDLMWDGILFITIINVFKSF